MLFTTIYVYCFGQGLDSLYIAFRDAKSTERRQEGLKIVKWLDERDFLPDSTLFDKNLSAIEFEQQLLNRTIRYLFRFEHYNLTYEGAQSLLKLSEATSDTTNLIISYYFLGFSCQRMGRMEEGLIHAKKCYELCLAAKDEEMLSSVMNNIANIYLVNKQDSMAVIYFQQTIDIERKLGRMQNLAIRLGNIATAYINSGKLDEAFSSVTEGLEIVRQEGRPDKIAIRLHQMCEVYLAMKDYEKARECELEALEYFKNTESKYGQAIVLDMLGEIEHGMNNKNMAEQYYLQALSLAEEIRNNLLIQRTCNNLYKLYRGNNFAQSLFYFERTIALRDSLFRAENQIQLNDFRIRYETAEKELEIERQQTEIARHKTRRLVYSAGLIAASLLLVLLIYSLMLRNRRNRELVETNATKDKFFSIISHDLKNPAIAQRDAVQLLLDNSGKWDSASLTNYYQKLLKSANGQVDLLYTLLGWAQLQTGRMPFHPAPFDLAAALQSCIELIQGMAEKKSIRFDVQMPETAFITGDYNMLTTVVRNLLTNAVKFTPQGGTVTLSISPTSPTSPASPISPFIVSVSDTGIGMTAEQKQTLFRLDRQHARMGTSGEQGSGLGLIICKELLQKHGSQLHVESEEGKGSRFWFELTV